MAGKIVLEQIKVSTHSTIEYKRIERINTMKRIMFIRTEHTLNNTMLTL